MTRPTAAHGNMPFPGSRTVAEVWEDDARRFIVRGPHPLSFVAPVAADRTPCPRCGIRADIGCEHTGNSANRCHARTVAQLDATARLRAEMRASVDLLSEGRAVTTTAPLPASLSVHEAHDA